MKHGLTTVESGEGITLRNESSDQLVASLSEKEWDSEFFGRRIASLSLDHGELPRLAPDALRPALGSLVAWADGHDFELVETQLDVLGVSLVPLLEELGFRLVDTKITFLSRLSKAQIPEYPSVPGRISFAQRSHLESILELTHDGFSNNPEFVSRYHNPAYFSAEETRRYFTAWIKNHLGREGAYFVVWELQGKVVGYYIYRRDGDHEGVPKYKGILCTIAPEARGMKGHLAMQSFLYSYIPDDPFWVDNTTQLNNYAVIKNHVFSQKSFERMVLIFFRRRLDADGSRT